MDCRNGSGIGCVRLAAWYRDEGNGRFNVPLSDAYLEDAEVIFTAQCGRDPGWIACGNRAAANQRLHHYQRLNEIWDQLHEMAQPVMNAVTAALCDAGEGRSCYELGFQYEHGQNIEQSLADALERYESACALEEKAGCIRLAWLLENGENWEDGTPDIPRALSLYESACGDGGCAELAAMYGLGNLVREDRSREKYYEEKGCALGEQCACLLLRASEKGPLTSFFCTMN
jgi:TPR repeat protein